MKTIVVRKTVDPSGSGGSNPSPSALIQENNDFMTSNEKRHNTAYQDFLNNPEKYCRGNYTPKHFKKEFMEEQGNKCARCGNPPIHNGEPLVFVLDHIDGDASNNRRENLRMICPNCDSQLPTFKSKNKNSTRRNYWKEHIIKSINQPEDEL